MNQKGFPQRMVDQTPKFENRVRKRKCNCNQVMAKCGIIRPDKRKKTRYL